MKKAKGKKLQLEKLNITKLEQLVLIKGGEKTEEPGDTVIFLMSNRLREGCQQNPTNNCVSGNTMFGS